MWVFIVLILFVTVVLSGLSVFLIKTSNRDTIKLLLAFSGAYLLSITFLHLIPEIYETSTGSSIGIFILLGFFLQIILEFFSKGLEHGHAHFHPEDGNNIPYAMFISLCIHSFLEAMPLAYGFATHQHGMHQEDNITNPLLLGIILHKIPIALIFMTMMLKSGASRSLSILMLTIFALMAPIGATVSFFIGENIVADMTLYFDKILAIVVGIFLHISTTILFESSEHHKFNVYKLLTIILGSMVAILSL
jgi:zinc and cadmium transporter